MKKIDKLMAMNNSNIEKEQMRKISGGIIIGAASCTLDTITVSPSGNKNDGSDTFQGECGSVKPIYRVAPFI